MALKSILKPDSSVTIGLAEAAVIYVIYQQALPNLTDVRAAQPHDGDVEANRKRAAWHSAILIGVVFLMTQDMNSAVIGGAALTAIDLHAKHSNAVSPSTGKMTASAAGPVSNNVSQFALPDYADQNVTY